MRWILVSLLFAASAGCSWEVHQRDPKTIDDITATVTYRQRDFLRASRTLATAATQTARPEDGERLAKEARNLELLEASEEVRLNAWKWREEQKSE